MDVSQFKHITDPAGDDQVKDDNTDKEVANNDLSNVWADSPTSVNQANGNIEETQRITNEDDYSDDEDEGDIIYSDMQIFFHSIGEPKLAERFLQQKVTLSQLLDFDEQDLINCGVDLIGDRKKIIENIGKMHCEKWQPTSLNDLTAKSMLSAPGIYVVLNDINKHFEYIGITFKYIRRQIRTKPEMLELGKDFVGVAKIASELTDLQKTVRTTCSELKALNQLIAKARKNPLLHPANHIDERHLRKVRFTQIIGPMVLFGLLAGVAFKLMRYIA